MINNKINPLRNLSTFRLETLEDGVFAIAMTILVLNLKIPDTLHNSLFIEIVHIWPNLITYFGSFILLGVFWFGHRAALNCVKHADQTFHWLNIILLLFVSVVPFSASLIAKYYFEQIAIIFYGLNLIAIGVIMTTQWYYATHNFRLIDPQLPIETIKFAKVRTMFAPLAYFIAVLCSFFSPLISLIIFTLVPILYIFPLFIPFWLYLAKIKFI